MYTDPLFGSDPISLIIASDLSLEDQLPSVDAVWQLSLDPQKPVQVDTNLGLKVRSLKIFPVFQIENQPISQISAFFSKPIIETWLPDYFSLVFRPQIGLQARYEVWARTPRDLTGRITLTNERQEVTEFGVQLVGELLSLDGMGTFAPTNYKYQSLLKGACGQIEIALWVDKHSKPILSPLPALSWKKAFVPGESTALFWQCGVLEAPKKSFDKINLQFPTNWDALIANRQSGFQAQWLEVETGNSDFDLAIRSSQHLAIQSRMGTSGYTKARNPSLNAATPPAALPDLPEIWQLVLANLTTGAEYASELVKQSVLSLQTARVEKAGRIEAPFPILSRLTWKVFQHTQDYDWLTNLFDPLLSLDLSWFDPSNDADQDGLPEWSSLNQTGFHSSFGFSLLDSQNLPGDIRQAENIALGVLLRSELNALNKIAHWLEKTMEAQRVQEYILKLDSALQTWVKESPDLSWRDAITHDATSGQKLFQDPHQAARMINLTLNTAARLHLQLRPNTQTQRPTSIVILGQDQQDLPIECRILPSKILWLPGFFYAMTEQAFKTIGSVTVEGLDFAELTLYAAALPKDDFCALFADFVDPGTQLPTSRLSDWLDQYARTAFGLPEFLNAITFPEAGQVNLFWHSLLLEELVDSGQNKTAYGLLKSLLSAQTKILNSEHALYSTSSAADAKPAGTRNSVGSLIPIEQLLEIAGVKILHARKVSIGGGNGFAQPITFRFRGLEVTRDGKNGRVRMPDGTEFHHFGSSTKTFQVD